MNEASNDNRTQPFSPGALLQRSDFSLQDLGWLSTELEKRNINTLNPTQCEDSRREMLSALKLGEDLVVFGYESLIWNTGFEPASSTPVTVTGWRRSFCIDALFGHGDAKRPGLMLALDKGGACTGVAHVIKASRIERDTPPLWLREMSAPLYRPMFMDATTQDGGTLRALAFVIDPASHLYAGSLELSVQARRIALAEGPLGRNRDVLYKCAEELKRRGIDDPYIEDLKARVQALTQDSTL